MTRVASRRDGGSVQRSLGDVRFVLRANASHHSGGDAAGTKAAFAREQLPRLRQIIAHPLGAVRTNGDALAAEDTQLRHDRRVAPLDLDGLDGAVADAFVAVLALALLGEYGVEIIHGFVFVCKPVNRPYLELAMKLSGMSTDKLRSVAEDLLDITF